MTPKEKKLSDILRLKSDAAEAQVAVQLARLAEIRDKISTIEQRRGMVPEDLHDQVIYNHHLSWLDARARSLSIEAAQTMVQLSEAKNTLRLQFGRKSAFTKVLEKKSRISRTS